MTAAEAKKQIGTRLYWVERSNRYIFERSGVLTSMHRGQLEFDESYDYHPPKHYSGLTVVPHGDQK